MKIISSAITQSVRLCPKCGAKLFSAASSSSCGACLLEAGLELLTAADCDEGSGSLPTELGDYELLGEIGRGGQGVVFRARQKSLNRFVALKIIGLGHWADETHLKRFRREAEAAASLKHSRIVPIYQIGEHDGACFFSMELIEGGQLDALVRREPLPLRRAAEIVASLARTLEHAHERGILHRDIKPGNILLDAEGEPHLADFGLARLVETESTVTRTLEVLGTPSYMAPEQAAGQNEHLSSATDVYGLGAVFYHLLTGHPPFAGGTTYETIRLVLETEPRNPQLWNPKVDRDLATICLKCLEKVPGRRYPSALALAEDLERWLGHEPVQARPAGIFYRGRKWVRRNPTLAALVPLAASLLGAIALLFWNHEPKPPPGGIAVLPFANLDGDKKDTVFADGIQDDILTRLAAIADLKVISRTSVMNYRGAQNTRQIGDALHVSHLLEGSVRRDGNRVRINVQLIDVRSDQPIWAEEYDRAADDVNFAKSDVAQQVAEELHLRLSPNEKAAIAHPPTKDLRAYDLYLCGAALIDNATGPEDFARSIELLNKALALDPNFLLAYCALAKAYDIVYIDEKRTPGVLAKAGAAIQSALRLAPNSGETHLARAIHFECGQSDYAHALTEFEVAGRTLPNDARVSYQTGAIDRRLGRWPEALRALERATELDPRNKLYLSTLASICWSVRDYDKASSALDRGLALEPDDLSLRLRRACLELGQRGNFRSPQAVLESVAARDPSSIYGELGIVRFWLAIYARDFSTASRSFKMVQNTGNFALGSSNESGVPVPASFFEGWLSQLKGDAKAARVSFLAARREQEKNSDYGPDSWQHLGGLGAIDAQLGRKEDALREGRRALELVPADHRAIDGVDVLYCYALICTWTGERDLALAQIEKLAKTPAGPAYGELRLDPSWDSLRDDPRFEKIVSSLPHKK